jgi:hypothetical protein
MSKNVKDGEPKHVVLAINKLMNLYKDALLSLVPELEKAQVKYTNYEEYEEVESICESLYNLIISIKLEQYVQEKYSVQPNLPKYGFFYRDYKNHDLIEVHPVDSDVRFIFVMLKSKDAPFDTVLCNQIDNVGNILERDIEFKWENVNFIFKFNTESK